MMCLESLFVLSISFDEIVLHCGSPQKDVPADPEHDKCCEKLKQPLNDLRGFSRLL